MRAASGLWPGVEMRAASERLREVERGDHHAFAEIELVRLLALRAGVKIELRATGLARQALHVQEERAADALRALRLVADEIVDVHLDAVDRIFVHAPHGDTGDALVAHGDAHARAV